MGRTVRAAGSHPRVARLLTVVASTRCVPARLGERLTAIYRRPLTSCAHRLRKPHRTNELLALSVARRARGRGLLPAPTPAPPCQIRRCRRRFRATTTGRTRTPSIGSTRALRPERARPRALFTCVASPRTLSLASSPFRPVKGRQVASSYPGLPETASPSPARHPPSATRKMRLSDFCNRLPSRAPCGSLDSRPRSVRAAPCGASRPSRRPILGVSRGGEVHGDPPTAYRMSQPGGASLDGEPPASARAATIT